MLTEYQINLITAFGTLGAVFVALFIVIIPAIFKKVRTNKIAKSTFRNKLWLIHELLRSYFFYNPTKLIIESNEISFSYDLTNLKLAIKVNESEIIHSLYNTINELSYSKSRNIINVLNRLELIFSGIPLHNTYWIDTDNELTEIRRSIFNDNRIGIKDSLKNIFERSIEIDKRKGVKIMKGAIKIKIGTDIITIPNHYNDEDSTRKYLFDRLFSALAEAKRIGIKPDQVSVSFDPEFIWD